MPPRLALVLCCALLTLIDATASAARVFAGDQGRETPSQENSSESPPDMALASAPLDRSEFERQLTAAETELRRYIAEQDFKAAAQIQSRCIGLWRSHAGENHWRTILEKGLYEDLERFGAISLIDRAKLREAAAAERAGRSRLELRDWNGAVANLSETIARLDELGLAKTATYASAVHALAIAEARSGRHKQAIERLENANRLYSRIFGHEQFRTAEVTVDIGRIQLQLGDVAEAKASVQEAIRILTVAGAQESEPYLIAASTLALTHFDEAQMWERIGLPERASEARTKAQALVNEVASNLEPSHALPEPRENVWNQFAVAAYLTKKTLYEEAAMLLEVIVESPAGPETPNSTLLVYHRANSLVLRALGRTIDANHSDSRVSDLETDALRFR